MTLTHQGHQFLRQSYLILATVDNAKRSLQIGTESLTGKLTVGVTSLVAGYFLVELLTRFKSAYPNVTVQVVEDERPYIEHLLVSGEIDIGVLILSNIEDRDALQTEVLMHSPYRLWLPPLHPLLEHESISLTDVAKQPLIQLNADEMDVHARRIWSRAGLKPEIAMKTASTEAVRSLVAAGMGGLHPAGYGVPRLVARGQHDRSAQAGRSAGTAGYRAGVAARQRAAGAGDAVPYHRARERQQTCRRA